MIDLMDFSDNLNDIQRILFLTYIIQEISENGIIDEKKLQQIAFQMILRHNAGLIDQ